MYYSTRRRVSGKIPYDKSADKAFTDVQEALNMVGNVGIAYNRIIEGSANYGYSENNKEKHESNPDKDGRDTNPEIDRVLGKHEINSNMEDEFLKFCEQNDIEPDNNERKYWKVSLILNSSSNLIF